jgi:3-oxoacyl-[acyl-carrier-protein] synthase III
VHTQDIFISGVGSFLPSIVSVEHAVQQGWYPPEEVELNELAGAVVAGPIPAPEMALLAAEKAVKSAGLAPDELDLLLYACTWLQGPEGWMAHSHLQRHLVGGKVPAYEIRMGCNGMFAALDLAVSHLRAEPERSSALLVASDNFGTPLMDRWRMLRGFIVGDASSALVLTKQPGFAQLLSVCSSTVPEAEQLNRGNGPMFPPPVTMGHDVNFVAGQVVAATVAGDADPALAAGLVKIREELVDVVGRALAESGIGIDDVTRVSFLNCSRETLEQRCMVPLGLPVEKSCWEFGRTIGHCGASDQLLALEHLITTGQLVPGDHLLMLGTAPGITISAAVVKILETPGWAG